MTAKVIMERWWWGGGGWLFLRSSSSLSIRPGETLETISFHFLFLLCAEDKVVQVRFSNLLWQWWWWCIHQAHVKLSSISPIATHQANNHDEGNLQAKSFSQTLTVLGFSRQKAFPYHNMLCILYVSGMLQWDEYTIEWCVDERQ